MDNQGPTKPISSTVANTQQNSVNTQTVIKLMLHRTGTYDFTVPFPLSSHYPTEKLEWSLETLIVFNPVAYTKVAASSQEYRQGIGLLSMCHT